MIQLWIDDLRVAPQGWHWEKTVDGAKAYILQHIIPNANQIAIISTDHDAGAEAQYGGDYIRLLDWLEQLQYERSFQMPRFHLHSMNPVGVQNMRRIIEHNHWQEIKNL